MPRGISQGGTNSSLTNIIIRDMDFYNIASANGIGYAYNATSQSILIENCATFNGGALWAQTSAGGSGIVRNIRVEQYNQGFAEILVESASGSSGPAASAVVEDCIVTTSVPVGVSAYAYIDVAFTVNAVVRNCVVNGGDCATFIFQNVNNLVVSDCIAQNGEGFSFGLVDAFSVVIERCVAQNNSQDGFAINAHVFNSLNVIDCVANNNVGNGFVVGAALSSDATIFKNCYAAQNGVCGFLLSNLNGGAILNTAFDGCVAQGNGGDGFILIMGCRSPSSHLRIYPSIIVSHKTIAVGAFMAHHPSLNLSRGWVWCKLGD